MPDGTTTIRVRGEHRGIPLDVASTLISIFGHAYPGTTLSTDTSGEPWC